VTPASPREPDGAVGALGLTPPHAVANRQKVSTAHRIVDPQVNASASHSRPAGLAVGDASLRQGTCLCCSARHDKGAPIGLELMRCAARSPLEVSRRVVTNDARRRALPRRIPAGCPCRSDGAALVAVYGYLNTRCLDLRWMPQHSDRVCSVFISRLAGRCAGSVESKSPRIASRCTSPGSTRVQHVRTCPRHWCGGQKQPRSDPRGSRAMFLQSDSGASVWCLRSTQSRGRRNSCFAVAITGSSRPGASACAQRPRSCRSISVRRRR
jgi:hypothetical protein